jgi:Flp pilus assembly protein TadB
MIPYAVSIKYMIAGYAVIFVVMIGFLISMVVRWKKLKRDMKVLEELEKQG